MKTPIVIFVVFSFLDVSTRADDDSVEGISPYCRQSQLDPLFYGRTPVECCDHRGTCDQTIAPNETKYGLTNTDPVWSRRSCSCDKRLWGCVMKDRLQGDLMDVFNTRGFRNIICFRPKPRTPIQRTITYEFKFFREIVYPNSFRRI